MITMRTPEGKKREIEIKILMLRCGITGADIARKVGPASWGAGVTRHHVSKEAIGMTISGRLKSKRLRTAIAEAVGVPYDQLWGE